MSKLPKDPVARWAFEERMFNAAQANVQRAGEIVGAQDLTRIPWPAVEHYGYDHGKQTSQLAVYIALSLPAFAPGAGTGAGTPATREREIAVLKSAALLHDLGRTQPWQKDDPGHQARSAELAYQVFRNDPSAWGDQDFQLAVGKLIAGHSLGGGAPPLDGNPLLVALWDAECFEAARFAPNTSEGGKILRERLKCVISPWAKVTEHKTRWMTYRGWDK